jgi:hypothetical protein
MRYSLVKAWRKQNSDVKQTEGAIWLTKIIGYTMNFSN